MKWFRLDERATTYAIEQLRLGGTLAQRCLEIVEDLQPWVWAADNVSSDNLHEFSRSLDRADQDRAETLPGALLFSYVEEDDPGWQRLLVFEDTHVRASYPYIAQRRHYTPVALMGEEVFQVVTRGCAGDALHLPVGKWPLVGVASRLPKSFEEFNDHDEVGVEFIETLAENAVAVLVGAWDAESYIVLDRGLLDSAELAGLR